MGGPVKELRDASPQGSAQPQRLVYGTTRVSGLIVFQGAGHKKITVTGQSVSARAPGHLFWVLPLAGHACEAFKDLYLDDFELKDTEISWGADPANAAYRQWSSNPALCVADYLTDRELGMGVPTAHIDWDLVVTAATVCDTLVDALGPVQPGNTLGPHIRHERFTSNGALLTRGHPSGQPHAVVGDHAGRDLRDRGEGDDPCPFMDGAGGIV